MPRVARLLVAFGVCSVDAGTPAEPPGSIGIIEPSEENFTISWSPGLANDCVFQAWQVRVRSRNLNGTLVGSWRDPACQVPTTREEPNCTVTGLQSNSPYDVQIFELCSSSSDDSSAGEPEEVLWTLPGYWDIHVPPHDSSIYVVEDTMEAHAGCEIIKSCCGDQFSLCFSGNESRTVEIQRVDTELGWEKQVGWGQDLYLRCHAPSVAPFKSDPLPQAQAEEPHYLRLHTSTHVTAQVVFHHGTFIGGCQCASHRLQTRPEGSSTWRTEGGDCLVPDLRGCSVQDLVPNARIYSRLQTTCLDESMNSNWSQTVDVITRPGCTWTFDSSIQGADVNQLECVDKTFCDIADETCCQSHGGRLRCPGNFSVMCENQDCVGGTDYCCVSSDVECDSHGGVRFCSPSMVPAEVPAFRDFNSYLASSLRIEWRRGVYLSEDDSPCGFQTWQIEVAPSYENGTIGTWVQMSNCATLGNEATSCDVGPEQGLVSLQTYVARMKELCTDATLNSEYSYTAGTATTWPVRAETPSNISFSNIRDHAFTVSWVPGMAYERHKQECDFAHWEVMLRMSSRYVQLGRAFGAIRWDAEAPERPDLYLEYEEGTDWFIGCQSFVRDTSSCDPQSLESDRDYDVKVRERCLDSHADSDYTAATSRPRTSAVAAYAPVNLTTDNIRKYRYDLLWDPGDRRACIFWAWQVMTKPVGVDWPPEDQDNATIEGGGHTFIYHRNITEHRFKLPLSSNTQYGARVRERCTDPTYDGEWGYLLYPGVWTAPPVQADQLENVTLHFNWPALLSIRFLTGPAGWLEDLEPSDPNYNSHSDCEFNGWYVEVADAATPTDWVVQQECLALPRSFEGCDIHTGLEYGKDYQLRVREGCTDDAARSPETVLSVTSRARTPAAAPANLRKNSDTAFSYEFSWDPGASYDCVFLRWEVQLRSLNDTNSSAAAWGDGLVEDIRSRIAGHSENPDGQVSSDWSVPVVACELPNDRELAWCRIEPLVPNAYIDLQVREICVDETLNSLLTVLQTKSPEAPTTQFSEAVLVAAGEEGNSLQIQFGGGNVGDCLDALPEMNVVPLGGLAWISITDLSFSLSQNAPYEPHQLVSGVTTAFGLQPDTLYFAQVRLGCPSGSDKDGPFLVAQQPMPTMPGCKWSRHSNRSEMLECSDASFCNFTADASCCSSLGGIQRCPPERPWMCESPSTCEESCASYGGRKSCSPSEWPANSPEIFEAASFAPASLSLRFGPRSYLSNNVSNCVFSRWDVQLAKVLPDSSLDTWTHLPQCDFAGSRELQSCQADDLDFLQYYQVRFAELCTDSGLDSLYNWTEPILIRGALAGSPVNLTVTVLSSSALLLRWDASSAGDCSFAAWKVEWQSGGASETWSPAELCQDLTERNQTECLLDTLTAMESYRVQITETCTDVRTNSLPATSPVFRFQEINSWEIYLGPTMSLAISVSTLVTDLDQCEVITTCCDDQFSICYARTAAVPLLATISRTDAVAGWGQQLWLRCSNSGDPAPSVPAAAPAWVELREVSQSSMVAAYSLGHAPGDCLCAHPHLQLRESGSEWVSVYGDCADMTLRACTLTNLLPDRVYDVRIQLACANESLNSPWTTSATVNTDPGCTWSTSSGNATGYECEDGSFCATEGCCSPRRCPDHMPVMCADSSCNGHFCCAADSAGCDSKGGVRPCLESQVPAKEPSILQVDSPSSSSLQITWTPGSYASGFTAPCGQGGVSEFLQWSVQVTEAEEERWRSVECSGSRSSNVCLIENLLADRFYEVRLAELCVDRQLDSTYSVALGRTRPVAAESPSTWSMELGGDVLNVTWQPGSNVHDCLFESWQLSWRPWGNSQWSNVTCSSQRSLPRCELPVQLDQVLELMITEKCQDVLAESAPLRSPPFRWRSNTVVEVYLGTSMTSVLVADIMTLPSDVVLALDPPGSIIGSFSLCFGDSHDVTVTRTDAIDGWAQELWLHVSVGAVGVDALGPWDAPKAEDVTVVPQMNAHGAFVEVSFQAVLELGTRCDCGVWDFQVKPENYSSAYGYAQEAHWAAPSHGTCAAASLSRRHCSAEQLRPDARYAARHRVACGLRAERGSNYSYASFVTAPACKWVSDSGYAELYECLDGHLCNATMSSCCNAHGGRARCPADRPVMCQRNLDCAEGQDRCCMATPEDCTDGHSGVRPCFWAEIPAKAPVITSVESLAPGELMVQWRLSEYLNGDRSRCSFTAWRLEVSLDGPEPDGVWQLASECTEQDRRVTSCRVQQLVSNANYSVRLREACTRMDYDSDWAIWPNAVTLPSAAAAPVATCVEPATKQGDAMRLQVAWTAEDPGDCRFQAWEVYLQLQDLDVAPWLACSVLQEQDTFCHVDHLWSGRSYDLQLRQVCSDPASSVVHALTGGQCTVTAVAASAPVNLTAHSVGPYELQVSWAAQHPWACTFYSWQVQVKPQASDQWASGLGCESLDRDVANCTVDVGLGSNTPYDVRVRESCVEAALNSTWLQLAFPGVSTPWPVKADGPSLLQVTQISAFELRITWLPGPFSNDCTFSAWDVELILADGSTEALVCTARPRAEALCEVSLRSLNLPDAGVSYGLRVRESCSDPFASSEYVQEDGILQLAASAAPIEALEVADAGEAWLLLTWVSGLSGCSASRWQVHWRQNADWMVVLCQMLPCNVTGLARNQAYEILIEEACENPWSLPSLSNASAVFWTLPGEWSTFIGTSDQHTVSLTLSAMPSRCYVQKECCADEFFLCHDSSDSRLVHVTRADVPGGWGQRLSLECVQPALSAISLRPQLQAIGPESLLLAPRDNQSVTVVHPLRLAGGLAGCECAEILVELAVEGSETWIPQSACNDWTLRECVVEPLEAGTTYEGRVRIQCQDQALSSNWTYAGATVTTNLEALVVEGSLTVTVGSGRRLGRRLAQLELQKVLSEVTALELRSILVTPLGGSDLGYILAAASIGRELDEASAQAAAEEAQRRLDASLASDFAGLLSAEVGSSVEVQVLQPPEVSRRSEAFGACSAPPLIPNAARNWSASSCAGRTWSDPPCAVPCDTGFLPEGSGFVCGVTGEWSTAPTCASIWSVSSWGPCTGVVGDCGDGGLQRREVTCPDSSGCHSMSKPIEEQPCRATIGCTWVTGDWSLCSNQCGLGARSRSVACSSPQSWDCADAPPVANESCSDYSQCEWQVQPWSTCSSSCGLGTQTREAHCPAEPTHCPSPAPSLVQYCYEISGCTWQTSTWSVCSNSCGAGTSTRQVWCSSGTDSDCGGSRPLELQSCYETVGCTWQKGSWTACSSSCGAGRRGRSVLCPSGQAADCPSPMPATEEECYETSDCLWITQSWSACDNGCGSGVRVRPVLCSSGLAADCASLPVPTAVESCYDVVGCAWSLGDWSSCSTTCGAGVRSRAVTCPSGWPADCASFEVEPASSESCRGRGCDWRLGEWSECSNDCGDGSKARTVRCSSGEDTDCVEAKPSNETSCRVTSGCGWTLGEWTDCDATCGAGLQHRTAVCDSGSAVDCVEQPVVIQNCYQTGGCSWQEGDWSSCSSSCGAGLRQRSVQCSSGHADDCVSSARPTGSEACYEQSGCTWQSSSWGDCSASCGSGLRTRQVWCDSLVDSDCHSRTMPARSETCYSTSSCTWQLGRWEECSSDCGTGLEARSVTCSGPRGESDCTEAAPNSSRSCFSNSNCAWQMQPWGPCNVSCGIGWQERMIQCPTGNDVDCPTKPSTWQRCYTQEGCQWLAGPWSGCSGTCEPGTRARNLTCSSHEETDCAQVQRPLDQESCNLDATGCQWTLGSWSSCSASTCGALGTRVRSVECPSRSGDSGCPVPKPRSLEPCLSEQTCEWQLLSEWSDCDASCGWGWSTRVVQCSAGADEDCPGEKPESEKACYSTSGCQWWTGQWSACNATCGLGLETRQVLCGSESCDPGTAPASERSCHSNAQCEWQIGDWGACSTSCGSGHASRAVQCPSTDADCAWAPRPLDRRSCRNITGCAWSISSWSVCSQSCGDGTRTRSAVCPSGEDTDCITTAGERPSLLESCREELGCAWSIGDWSSCSSACGAGRRQRVVACGAVGACNASTRPVDSEACVGESCGWSLGSWSSCSQSCGEGVQERSVQCIDPEGCGTAPPTQQVCFTTESCQWQLGPWSNCSDGCGIGWRSRDIRCGDAGLVAEHCPAPRPEDRESCEALRSRSRLGPSCGWTTGLWSACDACGPQQREVSCQGNCFGKPPSAVMPCQEAGCQEQGNATARFDVELLIEDVSMELLSKLIAGTRQAVATMLAVSIEEVQVKLVNDTKSRGRRLSTRLKLEVEVTGSSTGIAVLNSQQGQELLETELLETWDAQGLPLEDFSVMLGPVETLATGSTTTLEGPEQVEQKDPSNISSLVMVVVVLLTLCCSGTMGAIYCFCWSKGTSVVPQSPLALPSSPPHQKSGESLKSPTGGISPAAVSDLRSAAVEHTAQEEAEIPLRKEMLRPASVQVRVVNSGGATSPGKAEVRVEGSVRPARSATVASSRSPLSHAPRPASPSEPRVALTARSTKSEPHRLPLEPRPGQP